MKRRYRLREHDRLVQVRRQGKAWAHPLCVLVTLPNGLSYSRFGFSVSKRIGKAVIRNKVRRRLREVMRQHLTRIQPGWDVLCIARPPARQAVYTDLETAVLILLQQANLWPVSNGEVKHHA